HAAVPATGVAGRGTTLGGNRSLAGQPGRTPCGGDPGPVAAAQCGRSVSGAFQCCSAGAVQWLAERGGAGDPRRPSGPRPGVALGEVAQPAAQVGADFSSDG